MQKLKNVIKRYRVSMLMAKAGLSSSVDFLMAIVLKEDEMKLKHRKECDDLMLSLGAEERMIIMSWMKKKIDYLVYMNTKDKTDEMQHRLFQALLEHNQILSIHEAAKLIALKKEN